MLEGAYVCCIMAPQHRAKNPPRPPDTSTTHCEALPGAVYVAENGDRFAFDATHVQWTHAGTPERRAWTCETNRRVVLSGFDRDWKGTLWFLENGMVSFNNQPFHREGSGHVFPCERVAGRTYFAETNDSLAFLDSRTARWTTAAEARTVSWSCGPMRILLRDGTDVHEIVLRNSENLFWQELEWMHAPDGKRPPFPCDVVPGSRWRAASGETLAFGPKDVRWVIAGGPGSSLSWTCHGTTLVLERTEQAHPRYRFTLQGDRIHLTGGNTFERITAPAGADVQLPR